MLGLHWWWFGFVYCSLLWLCDLRNGEGFVVICVLGFVYGVILCWVSGFGCWLAFDSVLCVGLLFFGFLGVSFLVL